MEKEPLIGISRLRMGTDGHGITTLVAFHGCPLRCKYCLNPQCLSDSSTAMWRTPEEVMDILKKDELYFLATKGGITFGGGEPLQKPDFILKILELGAKRWHISVETSLNVDQHHIEMLLPYIHEYIVDVKDINPTIYEKYTGKSNNQVICNLQFLCEQGMAEKILCRIPLIPHYNNAACQYYTIEYLKGMGITRFDQFEYVTKPSKQLNMPERERRGLLGVSLEL